MKCPEKKDQIGRCLLRTTTQLCVQAARKKRIHRASGGHAIGQRVTNGVLRNGTFAGRAYSNGTRPWQ